MTFIGIAWIVFGIELLVVVRYIYKQYIAHCVFMSNLMDKREKEAEHWRELQEQIKEAK